jgi:L-methionine (R)-S-oxide reductase
MSDKKISRYLRLEKQITDLIKKNKDFDARMATINAILYHKMDGFFWVGFYLLKDGHLLVGPYQGPLACLELEKDKGVCWAGINQNQTIVVQDVHQFPGHIACDSRSKSEIVIPIRNPDNRVIGVLDIDSSLISNFDDTDAFHLEKIVDLLNY